MALRWPADFPEDCPPAEAAPADGIYYRIVKNDPPELHDFMPLYHLNRGLADARIHSDRATQCETMGLSIFADASDAIQLANRISSLGNKIARLKLGPDAGVILPTPREGDSHHTWWQPYSYNPARAVAIVITL